VDGIIPQPNPMIPVTAPTRITLIITGIKFVRWDGMEGRPKFNAYGGICKDGEYSGQLPTTSTNKFTVNLRPRIRK